MGNAAILRFVCDLVKDWDERRAACFARLVVGLMHAKRLGVAAIGRELPSQTTDKHRIKAVDRFLGNKKVELSPLWVSLLGFAARPGQLLPVLVDWTDLDEEHEVLVAAVCFGGRSLPVAWATTKKGDYRRSRNKVETDLCLLVKALLPGGIDPIFVADRGFCRASYFKALARAGLRFVVRIRRDVHLINEHGRGPVSNRRVRRGHTRDIPEAKYGENARFDVRCVLTFGRGEGKNMPRSPWYLVTNIPPEILRAITIVEIYKRRMRIEHNFRDHKSLRFGFQLRAVHLTKPERYDRLLAIAAIAMLLLVFLGAVVENRGLHRQFKANTDQRRTHSLFYLGLAFIHRALIDKPRLWIIASCFDGQLEGMG